MIAHLSVVSLVAVASLTGLSQTPAAGETNSDFLALVQQARGAADQASSYESLTYELGGAPEEQVLLERSTRATVPPDGAPQDAGPLPTPVAVDPNATPLPGPQSTGSTTTGVAPTTRIGVPAPATGALVWPVPAGGISQYYHAAHLALDIAASYGSSVVAAQGGTVTSAGWRNNGGGLVISIDHGNGMTTVYNHLGSIWVSPGQYVGAGQGIAGIGCTGTCTGPHTHFEVIVNGVIDNPLRYY